MKMGKDKETTEKSIEVLKDNVMLLASKVDDLTKDRKSVV